MSVTDIQNIFNSLSLKDLLKCRKLLDATIDKSIHNDKKRVAAINVEPLVKYHENFIEVNSELYKGVKSDIEKLGLDKQKEAQKSMQNLWLTSTGQSYTWTSKKSSKSFEHKPVLISNYAHIDQLRVIINDKFGSDLNSCLATYYPTGSGVTLHADDEKELDDLQPISVASFGDLQSVEFVKKYRGSNARADLSFQPADGSLYSMLPNCQEVLRHRVKPATDKAKSWRVSLSFRRMLSNEEVDKNSTSIRVDHDFTFSPVKKMIKNFEEFSQNQSSTSVTDVEEKKDVTENKKEDIQSNINAAPEMRSKKSTTVIFGTSITKHIEEKKLQGKGQRCINISKSGAKIIDIHHMVDEFVYLNEYAGDVNNIIFNFGTNDIKHEKFGVNKYRESILSLLNKTKLAFPFAKIMIFSTLPMKNLYKYTVRNFLRFNEILYECALVYNCIYVDCFWHFLTADKRDINRELYCWDGVHLNTEGIYFLGRWMHYMISMKSFNNVISYVPM